MSGGQEALPVVIPSTILAASELTKSPSGLIPQDAYVLVLASSMKLQAKFMLKFSLFLIDIAFLKKTKTQN